MRYRPLTGYPVRWRRSFLPVLSCLVFGSEQPQLVAFIDFVTYNYGQLRFVNAGSGAALNLDITYGGEGGEQRSLNEPVMVAGDGLSYKLLSVLESEASEGEGLGHLRTGNDRR